jgi:NitT/TauT family transport system substrate-binding protein
MRVGSVVFPGYEDLFLARELGLLDARQVRLVELLSNTDTLRALSAGQLEAATLKLDEVLSARADGVNLQVVLVMDVSQGADLVLARPALELDNLIGRSVAVPDTASGALLFNALLQASKLPAEKLYRVPASPERAEELFLSGMVDAVVTSYPWATRLQNLGALTLFDSGATPGRLLDVLAVRSDALATHGPALRHLLQCHFEAQQQFKNAPDRCTPLMAQRLRIQSSEVMAQFRGLLLPDLAQNRSLLAAGGTLDQNAQSMHQLMQRDGLLPATPQLALPRGLANASYLPL